MGEGGGGKRGIGGGGGACEVGAEKKHAVRQASMYKVTNYTQRNKQGVWKLAGRVCRVGWGGGGKQPAVLLAACKGRG